MQSSAESCITALTTVMVVTEEIDATLVYSFSPCWQEKGTVADVAYHAIRAGRGTLATIGYIGLQVVTLPLLCQTRRARKLALADAQYSEGPHQRCRPAVG